jgi:hypothetical protein
MPIPSSTRSTRNQARIVRGPLHDDRDALPGKLRLRAAHHRRGQRSRSMCSCTRRFLCIPGVVVRCRPLGVLRMEDEAGDDAKVLAVPTDKISARYIHLLEIDRGRARGAPHRRFEHFFEHYKDLEPGKWVRDHRLGRMWTAAHEEVLSGARRYADRPRPAAP